MWAAWLGFVVLWLVVLGLSKLGSGGFLGGFGGLLCAPGFLVKYFEGFIALGWRLASSLALRWLL